MAASTTNQPTKDVYLGKSREAARKAAKYTRRRRRKSLREIAGSA